MPELWGLGGPLALPIFGRSVNPSPAGEGRLSPPITTGTPNVFHLQASLMNCTHDLDAREKFYNCEICDKDFSFKCALIRHINSVHARKHH